ncbi:DUF6048 family protein [Fulvivirga sediminis]|uniref:DUF481 domain-containing protein n=1 Tax=Fulvivirga sediminis TaxID=2803949 RepID=A0A937F5V4_9BACT|nr:DUF6048 family protein [Fulvivirga sediminis]MBL3655576.1 hypothetical protein [Fulvivirga sediminis]
MIIRLLLIFSICSLFAFRATAQTDSLLVSPQPDTMVTEIDTIRTDSTINASIITDSTQQTTNKKPEKVKVKVKNAFQVFIDYGKIITLATDYETKYEGGIAFQMTNKFVLVGHIGQAELNPANAIKNGDYTAKGQYFKAGINYLLPLDNFNYFYVGGRYGMATYDESGSYEVSSTLWPSVTESFDRSALSATWGEVLVGTERKLTDYVIVGATFALRFMIEKETFEPVDTYSIPGYGRGFDNTVPAVNLYLKLSL